MIRNEDAWKRARRVIQQIKERMIAAQYEEDFQGIGHLAREAFISMAQAVYAPARHPSEDGVVPSETDAKRMLVSFVAAELGGTSNEDLRKLLRESVMYADAVTHKRSARRIDAEFAVAALESVDRLISISEVSTQAQSRGPASRSTDDISRGLDQAYTNWKTANLYHRWSNSKRHCADRA